MTAATTSPDLIALVRAGDYARFLTIQLAPREQRASLYALTALGLELDRVGQVTSEPITAMLRFTWWRESLEAIAAGEAPRHHLTVLAMAQLFAQSPAAFQTGLAMIATHQEAVESGEMVEPHPFLEEGWVHVLGETEAEKLQKIHAWLIKQDAQRLHRPWLVIQLLWKALKN